MSIVVYHSGFPEFLFMKDIWSSAINHWLKQQFMHYGCSEEIVMDNSPQFASAEFNLFLEENGIMPLMASVFNPHGEWLSRVMEQTLKYDIQAFCTPDRQWKDGIMELLSQHRHMLSTRGVVPSCTILPASHEAHI